MEKLISAVINFYYPADSLLRQTLLKHSAQVRDKALVIAAGSPHIKLDRDLIVLGSMLHDTGIICCHAPSIYCTGDADYICHGILGGKMLREYGKRFSVDLEAAARICERHTGSGLSAVEIRTQKLPLPEMDLLPETPEEKLICLADKFFSKSGSMQEKPLAKIRTSLARHGNETVVRFEELCKLFGIV